MGKRKASLAGEAAERAEQAGKPRLALEAPRVVAAPAAMALNGSMAELREDIEERSMGGVGSMEHILLAVVKVFVTSTSPNYAMPWQMKHQQKSTASGFAIDGRRLLTNAHAVAHHTLVMVRKHGNPKKYVAKVEAVGHECDIALLSVAEGEFWRGVAPLALSAVPLLPRLQEVVTVVGYPAGGDNVSVTKGVVSRLEMQQYSHGAGDEYCAAAACTLLAIQIDAAINSGNSGGPALKDDKVIGIAFETLESAENIGYIIPVPVIEHFLEDIRRHGLYTGFCNLGIFWQVMENADLREYYGVAAEESGILITRVQPLARAREVIQSGDVLLAFDGVPIADDGTVPFRAAERIEFQHLVTQKFLGDTCKLRILRDKKIIEAEAPIGNIQPLVPVHLYDLYGKDWEAKAPYRLCEKAAAGQRDQADQQPVLLAQVLAAEINNGYQNIASLEVISCNDVPVRNLRHLATLVLENTNPYLNIEFEKRRIVLKVERANAVSAEILSQNFIPAAYPKGLLENPPGGIHAERRRKAVAAAAERRRERGSEDEVKESERENEREMEKEKEMRVEKEGGGQVEREEGESQMERGSEDEVKESERENEREMEKEKEMRVEKEGGGQVEREEGESQMERGSEDEVKESEREKEMEIGREKMREREGVMEMERERESVQGDEAARKGGKGSVVISEEGGEGEGDGLKEGKRVKESKGGVGKRLKTEAAKKEVLRKSPRKKS